MLLDIGEGNQKTEQLILLGHSIDCMHGQGRRRKGGGG